MPDQPTLSPPHLLQLPEATEQEGNMQLPAHTSSGSSQATAAIIDESNSRVAGSGIAVASRYRYGDSPTPEPVYRYRDGYSSTPDESASGYSSIPDESDYHYRYRRSPTPEAVYRYRYGRSPDESHSRARRSDIDVVSRHSYRGRRMPAMSDMNDSEADAENIETETAPFAPRAGNGLVSSRKRRAVSLDSQVSPRKRRAVPVDWHIAGTKRIMNELITETDAVKDSDQAADPELASHYDSDSAEDTDTSYWRDPDANSEADGHDIETALFAPGYGKGLVSRRIRRAVTLNWETPSYRADMFLKMGDNIKHLKAQSEEYRLKNEKYRVKIRKLKAQSEEYRLKNEQYRVKIGKLEAKRRREKKVAQRM
jgi:hypothetical protein